MLKRTRVLASLTLLTLAPLLMLVSGTQPAAAHHDIVYHNNDEASVSADHMTAFVCDKEYDGNAVLGYFDLENGDTVSFYDQDGDGVEGPGHNGCWQLSLSSPALVMHVCEMGKGCQSERT